MLLVFESVIDRNCDRVRCPVCMDNDWTVDWAERVRDSGQPPSNGLSAGLLELPQKPQQRGNYVRRLPRPSVVLLVEASDSFQVDLGSCDPKRASGKGWSVLG